MVLTLRHCAAFLGVTDRKNFMDSTAMSWREHSRQNMRLALPLMIGHLATIGIWASDTIAIRRLGRVAA